MGVGALTDFGPLLANPRTLFLGAAAQFGIFATLLGALGRDVLSRVLIGAQLSMVVGFLAAGLATVISILIGVLSGYFGGRLDMLIQRFVDAWMTFPDLLLLIVVISILGPGMPQIIVVLGFLYGVAGSRIVRGSVVSVKESMYTHAAHSIGASTLRILIKHILPNVMPVVIVLFTTRVGATILAEAGLSFLGLGVPPPSPTWGRSPCCAASRALIMDRIGDQLFAGSGFP